MKKHLIYKFFIKKKLSDLMQKSGFIKKNLSFQLKHLIYNYCKNKKYCIVQHKHRSTQSFLKINRFTFKKMCYNGYVFGFLKK